MTQELSDLLTKCVEDFSNRYKSEIARACKPIIDDIMDNGNIPEGYTLSICEVNYTDRLAVKPITLEEYMSKQWQAVDH